MSNEAAPALTRKRAWRSFNSILAQVRDRKLVTLRHRLVKARLAGDIAEAEKIEELIQEHSWRHHY
jgi:hypothetical protein